MRGPLLSLVFISALLLWPAPLPVAAQTIYVDANAAPGGNGQTWATAYEYLQDALHKPPASGDEIWVAAGTYTPDSDSAEPNGNGDRYATFQLVNGVAVKGGYAGFVEPDPNARDVHAYETVLSGDLSNNDGPDFMNNDENSYHVVTGSGTDATAVLDGFVIRAGNADRGGPPHCFGGGMYSESGSPTVTNCIFSGNFSHNGGGMFNLSSAITITNCVFRGNLAGDAGAILNDYSSATLINCIFTGNTANLTSGGGLYDSHSNSTLINCTFSKNSSKRWGGAIHGGFSEPTLINCILWGNMATDGSQISMKYGSIVSASYSNIQGGPSQIYLYQSSVSWGDGNINEDPLFVDPNGADNVLGTSDDNLRLLAGSPCLDAGDNSAVPSSVLTDLDGNPRFTDDPVTPDTGNGTPPIVDMGAYEGPNGGLLLSTESVTVPEAGTAVFTVALLADPLATVELAVTWGAGDTDITVQSGELLVFDSSNYSVPQTVTLAAAEDADHIHGQALIVVGGEGFATVGVTAIELDNEPDTNILHVDAGASGANNGSSWVDAFTDLQEALSTAAVFPQFEQILVAQGIYTPAEPAGDRTTSFRLVNRVDLYGGFPSGGGQSNDRDPSAYETILSGDLNGDDGGSFANYDENSYHVVNSSGADETTVIDGFTIIGGNANGVYPFNSGGGIYNEGGETYACTLTINSCRITGNWAYYGGGILNYYTGIVIIGLGGPGPTITNCVFTGNAAGSGGGAIYNDSSNPIVTNCRINENSATQDAGGILNDASCPHLTNCTLGGNSAGRNAGGIINLDCWNPIFTNCTFNKNYAGQNGGALYSWMSNPLVTNCIFWGNSDSGGMDESAQIYGGVFLVSHSCIQGLDTLAGNSNIDQAPCFVDAFNNDYHLMAGSPCIDAGDNGFVPADSTDLDGDGNTAEQIPFDLDGNPRLVDGDHNSTLIVDMGAYEWHSAIFVDANATGANNGASWTDAFNYLQDALTLAGYSGEIWVAEGVYTPDCNSAEPKGTGDRTATFRLISGIAIYGGFPSGGAAWEDRDPGKYETILSGDLGGNDADVNDPCDLLAEPTRADNSYHVVMASDTDGTAVLDGFTITAGNANGSDANDGGGMYSCYSTPTVANCTFTRNSASDSGGGMNNNTASDPVVTNCSFLGNYAHGGGGMSNYSSGPTLVNCTFSGNSAGSWGGGGMANYVESSPTLVNCTFSRNSAQNYGGGLSNWLGSPTLTNCSFWANTDDGPTDESAQIFVYSGTPVVNYCCIHGLTGALAGTGNIGDDPLFVDPDGLDDIIGSEDDNLRLQPASPCIDIGDNNALPVDVAMDLDGQPRTMDGDCNCLTVVDIGAYEFGYIGDLDCDEFVNSVDFAILALAWLTQPGSGGWNPCCDVGVPTDNYIDWLDLDVLADRWLTGK